MMTTRGTNDEHQREATDVTPRPRSSGTVLAGMEPPMSMSRSPDFVVARGLNPVQFYAWKKQLLGSAARVFEDRRGRHWRRAWEQRREAELQRLKNVIAGDHRREPRTKKGAFGLEDHGQLPA